MKSRSAPLFFLILLAAVVAIAIAARKGRLIGGWKSIADVKDPHVQEIGKFAVKEKNAKSAESALVFVDVLSGESQVVAGINYRLVILAEDGGSEGKYQAVVWEKPWENFKQLRSFNRINLFIMLFGISL